MELASQIASLVSTLGLLGVVLALYQLRQARLKLKRERTIQFEEKIFDIRSDLYRLEAQIEFAKCLQLYLGFNSLEEKDIEESKEIAYQKIKTQFSNRLLELNVLSLSDIKMLALDNSYMEDFLDKVFIYLNLCDKVAYLHGEGLINTEMFNPLVMHYVWNAHDEFGKYINRLPQTTHFTEEVFPNLRK